MNTTSRAKARIHDRRELVRGIILNAAPSLNVSDESTNPLHIAAKKLPSLTSFDRQRASTYPASQSLGLTPTDVNTVFFQPRDKAGNLLGATTVSRTGMLRAFDRAIAGKGAYYDQPRAKKAA